MECYPYQKSEGEQIKGLFSDSFSQAEGPEEGQVIASLVADMMSFTDEPDIHGFVAKEGDALLGCIFFTRLRFEEPTDAFILSPVAVHPQHQRRGIGQGLIRYGIDALRSTGVSLLFTYGDPDYYGRVGFRQISEDLIKAPHELSQPIGWLCQSLVGDSIPAMRSKPACVQALDKPAYW